MDFKQMSDRQLLVYFESLNKDLIQARKLDSHETVYLILERVLAIVTEFNVRKQKEIDALVSDL